MTGEPDRAAQYRRIAAELRRRILSEAPPDVGACYTALLVVARYGSRHVAIKGLNMLSEAQSTEHPGWTGQANEG